MAQRAEETDSTDDDLPPLEDMTEYVERVKKRKKKPERKSTKASNAKPSEEPPAPSFGGLKKGFLFSTPDDQKKKAKKPSPGKPKATSSSSDKDQSKVPPLKKGDDDQDIPFITGQGGAGNGRGEGLTFPEVQEAMKESFPLLQSQDWVTDDLLSKIKEHPTLSKVFQDPRLSEVLSQFNSNPEAVMAASRDNPELQQFLRDFCGLMGEHFTALCDGEERKEEGTKKGVKEGEREGKKTKRKEGATAGTAPLVSEATPISPEEAKITEVLQKPEVTAVLSDPEIKLLLVLLKHNPNRAQIMMQRSSPEFRTKVRVLVENGVLGLQTI